MNTLIIIGIFVFIIVLGIGLIFIFSRNRKLSSKETILFQKAVKQISLLPSAKEQITDYDKLYHKILTTLGHKGSFGKILKSKPREITNLQKIWELHKLRNTLVHEFEHGEEKFLKTKSAQYKKEAQALLKRVS